MASLSHLSAQNNLLKLLEKPKKLLQGVDPGLRKTASNQDLMKSEMFINFYELDSSAKINQIAIVHLLFTFGK